MRNDVWTIFLTLVITTVSAASNDSCLLTYEKDVPEKPDIIMLTEGNKVVKPAICRINSTELASTKNYYVQYDSQLKFVPFFPTPPCRGRLRDHRCENIRVGYFPPAGRFVKPRTITAKFKSLNYDAKEQSILYFWSTRNDHTDIVKQNLTDSKLVPVFFGNYTEKSSKESTDFAYDWITKNVYINSYNRISVVSLSSPMRTAEIISKRLHVKNIIVHPIKGYLFFIDAERYVKNTRKKRYSLKWAIYRAYLDGSNIIQISEFVNKELFALNIDYHSDRLYWSLPSSKIIQHSKLDGTDLKNFTCESYSTIAFDKNYIYYVDGKTYSIVRHKKFDYEADKDFRIKSIQNNTILSFVINDVESQKIPDDLPCLPHNGNCQQFCFAVPETSDKLKSVCGCKNGEMLDTDLLSCILVENVTSHQTNNSTESSN